MYSLYWYLESDCLQIWNPYLSNLNAVHKEDPLRVRTPDFTMCIIQAISSYFYFMFIFSKLFNRIIELLIRETLEEKLCFIFRCEAGIWKSMAVWPIQAQNITAPPILQNFLFISPRKTSSNKTVKWVNRSKLKLNLNTIK